MKMVQWRLFIMKDRRRRLEQEDDATSFNEQNHEFD